MPNSTVWWEVDPARWVCTFPLSIMGPVNRCSSDLGIGQGVVAVFSEAKAACRLVVRPGPAEIGSNLGRPRSGFVDDGRRLHAS
jgi:hypothetical protein